MSEEKKSTATNQVAKKEPTENPVELVATKTLFLGIHHKAGEFKDEKTGKMVNFDNVEIFISDIPEATQNTLICYGAEAYMIKIKGENAGSVFGYDDFNADFNPEHWLGREVDIRYDRKGKVTSIVRV